MPWDELILIPQWDLALQVIIRLLLAAFLGGAIGYDREIHAKAAGIRTHMLVSLGAAIVIIVSRLDGIPMSEMSRVIEGVVTGTGFIGGGVILKLSQEREIRGVTTAASIWVTAAIGISVGLGQAWVAVLCTIVVWFILVVLGYFEKKYLGTDEHSKM